MLALGKAAAGHDVTVRGHLMEEMAVPGWEVVIGGLVDARFSSVVILELGCVFVENFADTAFRVWPIDDATRKT